LKGFVMKNLAPAAIAASACCGSELADMITSGTLRIFGSARISRASSSPFMPGISRSLTTKRYDFSRNFCKAVGPS